MCAEDAQWSFCATQDSFGDISRIGSAEKVMTTVRAGVVIAARDASGALGAFLKNQKNDTILFGGVVIIAGAQFVLGVDVAVDVTICIVCAMMYASIGPEHRENVGKALGKLKYPDRWRFIASGAYFASRLRFVEIKASRR